MLAVKIMVVLVAMVLLVVVCNILPHLIIQLIGVINNVAN